MSVNISEILLDASAQAESEIIAIALDEEDSIDDMESFPLSDGSQSGRLRRWLEYKKDYNAYSSEDELIISDIGTAEDLLHYAFQMYVINLHFHANPNL